MTDPETTGRDQAGRFAAGNSGNPSGRPCGARHAALLALDAIGAEGAEAVLGKVVEAARGGDMRAADILLRRLWPERKGRPIALTLPTLRASQDLAVALAVVADAMAAGEVTPEEAHAASAVLETWRKAVETVDIEQRLAALERATQEKAR